MKSWLLPFCLLSFLALPLRAQLRQIDRAKTDAVLEKLEDLSKWCRTQKLKGERVLVLESLVRFYPQDRVRRAAVGYRKRKGRWERPRSWKRPKTHPKVRAELGGEFRKRHSAILEDFLREMRQRVQDPSLREDVSHHARHDLVALSPDDEELRALIGEVRGDGGWILQSAATARLRREELKAKGQEFLAAAQGACARAGDNHSLDELGISFLGRARCGQVRALSTVDQGEAVRIATASEAARKLFNWSYGQEAATRAGFTIASLHQPAHKPLWLAHPSLSDEQRRFAEKLGCCWATTSAVAVWQKQANERLDMGVRQTLATSIMDGLGITQKQGWAFEGIGLQLCHAVIGTRLSWFVQPTGYGQVKKDWGKKLRAQNADWHQLCAELLRSSDCPDLITLLGKDVNTLSPQDLLAGFAISAWLIEGHPKEASGLLKALGRGEQPAEAFPKHLGVSLPLLREHLVRFYRETGL